jgi:hypothetical protein
MKYLLLLLPITISGLLFFPGVPAPGAKAMIISPASPQATYGTTLFKLNTPFYIPPKVGSGDKDFGGHGPNVTCNVSLSISPDKKSIIAHVTLHAKETRSDWTECNGSVDFVIYNCSSFKHTIVSINSRTISNCSYTDNDHEEDFVTGGGSSKERTFAQNSNWSLTSSSPGDLVAFYRFMGDDNGDDAGVKTGVQIFFNPIDLTMKGDAISETFLDVPGAPTCGINTCASSASAAFLNYYHVPGITCDHMRTLYQSIATSPNVSSYIKLLTGDNIGVDPNTVRDRLREIRHEVMLEEINNPSVIERIKTLLNSNKPVIALTGWGSKTVRDFYCRSDDNVSLNPNSVLHFIVIDGYNRETNVFDIVDNGSRTYMSMEYLKNIILWHPENFTIEAGLYGAQTKPGKIIY